MLDITTLTKLEPCVPSAVALGYFDGVHLGHRSVLGAAEEKAKAEEAPSAPSAACSSFGSSA